MTWNEISWEENFISNSNKRFWKSALNWENVENTAIYQSYPFLNKTNLLDRTPRNLKGSRLQVNDQFPKWSIRVTQKTVPNCETDQSQPATSLTGTWLPIHWSMNMYQRTIRHRRSRPTTQGNSRSAWANRSINDKQLLKQIRSCSSMISDRTA